MDLAYHFVAGGLISLVLLLVLSKPDSNGRRNSFIILLAALLPLFIGVAKELGDLWFGWGTPEAADVTFTWSGGLVALFVVIFIDTIRYERKK